MIEKGLKSRRDTARRTMLSERLPTLRIMPDNTCFLYLATSKSVAALGKNTAPSLHGTVSLLFALALNPFQTPTTHPCKNISRIASPPSIAYASEGGEIINKPNMQAPASALTLSSRSTPCFRIPATAAWYTSEDKYEGRRLGLCKSMIAQSRRPCMLVMRIQDPTSPRSSMV